MHLSLRALLDGTVRVEDDDLRVSDAWIDASAMTLRYVGLDVGGWLDRHVALVSAERLSWAEGWRADLSREQVEADEARLKEGGGGLIDIAALPPVITGPFGHTFSPMLIGAALRAEAEAEMPPHRPAEETGGTEAPRDEARALDRAADWIGAAVAPRDGPADLELSDLLIDPEDRRITHLVIEAAGRPRAVPAASVDRRSGPEAPVSLALSVAEIEACPEMVTPREAARRDPR